MGSCNPVAPVMDWTEDTELHKRYMEWKEEVELEIGSTLSGKSNSVKSMYSDGQASQQETILKVYQTQNSSMNVDSNVNNTAFSQRPDG